MSRGCNENDFTFFESQYAKISTYLGPFELIPGLDAMYDRDGWTISVGSVVSGIALFLWVMCMMKELRSLHRTSVAILCLPTLPMGHPSLRFSKETDGDPVYVVQGFSRLRKVHPASFLNFVDMSDQSHLQPKLWSCPGSPFLGHPPSKTLSIRVIPGLCGLLSLLLKMTLLSAPRWGVGR